MFIIFGSPRSGTTLLATTLSLHSSLKVIDQTDFIVPAAFVFDRIQDVDTGRRLLLDLICSSRYFQASLGRFLDQAEVWNILINTAYEMPALLQALYGAIAKKSDKTSCGDKSVSDLGYFPILSRVGLLNSTIKFVHIVRDVRAVCASLERLDWVNDRHIYPRAWANANLSLHELMHEQDNYFFLRYEDLVTQPRQTLSGVCRFLGFEYEPQMQEHPARGLEYVQDHHHANLQRPFMAENIDQWKQTLSDELRRCCAVQAREALDRFRYTTD